MIEKFKNNFFSLNEAIDNKDKLFNFLLDKKAFSEEFIKMICESNELNKITNVRLNKTSNYKSKNYFFDIKKIDNNYKIEYNKDIKKLKINISDNDIFSYYDDMTTLRKKLNDYIKNEEYEKADILNKYIKTCYI